MAPTPTGVIWMSKIHKIIIHKDDIPKLKKHKFLRVGKNLIVLDEIPVRQVKVFGKQI